MAERSTRPETMRDTVAPKTTASMMPVGRRTMIDQQRTWCLFTSAGDKNSIRLWLQGDSPRRWDLVVAYYGDDEDEFSEISAVAVYAFRTKGAKFQNIKKLVERNPRFFDHYSYVWVCDDDIRMSAAQIDEAFTLSQFFEFWVAQPAFLAAGKISHRVTRFSGPQCSWRLVNFVEVNTPIFRRDKLLEFLAVFDGSLTGWGIDYWYMNLFNAQEFARCAVIDQVAVINPHDSERGGGESTRLEPTRVKRAKWNEAKARYGLGEFPHKVFAYFFSRRRGDASSARVIDDVGVTPCDMMSDEQLKHFAVIMNDCYAWFDLAFHGVKSSEVPSLFFAAVERNPEDAWAVLYLAQSYVDRGDFANARKWFARRVEMGGRDEEVYGAMWQIAESMAELGAPWPDVHDAYIRAWEFRPTRAEPLCALAYRYRENQRYRLGYLFARHAAEIPFPEQDTLFVVRDIYASRALDEQAVCASWINKHPEAFTLWRRLLTRPELPDDDRQRIALNRDVCVPTMLEQASSYPDAVVQSLHRLVASQRETDVVVSLVAGRDRDSAEHTLNSFLHCCLDVSRVGRFLVIDAGLSAKDRAILAERYGFLEFADPGAQLTSTQIDRRFWLHLGQGWRFFAPENLITRLTAVLDAEPKVFQVAINVTDAVTLTGTSAAEVSVRRAPDAGRYVLTDAVARGPAMFDTARVDLTGGVNVTDTDPITGLGRRATAAGLGSASLDEVLCIAEP